MKYTFVRKILCLFLVFTILSPIITGSMSKAGSEASYPVGDLDLSGAVATVDASILLRYIVGLTTLNEAALYLADTNGDGAVTAADAVLILRYIVGLVTSLPPIQHMDGDVTMAKAFELFLNNGLSIDEYGFEPISVNESNVEQYPVPIGNYIVFILWDDLYMPETIGASQEIKIFFPCNDNFDLLTATATHASWHDQEIYNPTMEFFEKQLLQYPDCIDPDLENAAERFAIAFNLGYKVEKEIKQYAITKGGEVRYVYNNRIFTVGELSGDGQIRQSFVWFLALYKNDVEIGVVRYNIGIDFNDNSAEDLTDASQLLFKYGIYGYDLATNYDGIFDAIDTFNW